MWFCLEIFKLHTFLFLRKKIKNAEIKHCQFCTQGPCLHFPSQGSKEVGGQNQYLGEVSFRSNLPSDPLNQSSHISYNGFLIFEEMAPQLQKFFKLQLMA